MNCQNATTETAVHCFEKAGMGKAPFTYVGEKYQEIQYGRAVIGHIGGATVTTTPGGTCEYCGAYILNMFRIRSADGIESVVGSDCVLKTGDAGLVKKVETILKKMNRERTAARKEAKKVTDRELCEATDLNQFANRSHPNNYFASQGKTLANWCQWNMDNKNWTTLAKFIRTADHNPGV